MNLFENTNARELFSSITAVDDVAELYARGLETLNPILAICAQNELARRGCNEKIHEILVEFLDNNKSNIDPGNTFYQLLSTSLSSLGKIDPVTLRISKEIANLTVDGDTLDLNIPEDVTEEAVLKDTLRKMITKHGLSDREFYQMVDNVFEEFD